MNKHYLYSSLVGLLIAWASIAGGGKVAAQILPDSSLPNNSQVTTTGNLSTITGGTERGTNLFHSFTLFSVPTGRTAWFNNALQTQNILTRVTGRLPSDIDGLLKANGTANLYLLNPQGIVFGPHARLDIGGSFLASTASSFKFPDGSEFSAINPQAPPLLSVNVTPGLQYGPTPATLSNRGTLVTGQDLTLAASHLDVQGTVQAGRDLSLQAQDRVQIGDTATTPLIAAAGRNLQVQGSTVDIFALNHPDSGFWSGRDLVLRSNYPITGDAHFRAGSSFRVEQLNGSPGSLRSPHDPIILTGGDVSLGDYTGASLHILAGGSVTLSGNMTIDTTGDTATTINPSNTVLFNGSRTYADLATFNLTEYRATLNSDGSVRSVDPVAVPITINGSTQATVDIRAGVDWALLGGLPTSPVVAGVVAPAPTYAAEMPTRADITVKGIRVSQAAGLVLLTNQFSPNPLPGTISIAGNVDTSTEEPGKNGGDIRVYGRGDILALGPDPSNPISLISTSSDANTENSGNSGNGGNIAFATNSGNISLTNSAVISRSFAYSLYGPWPSVSSSGDGGNISFVTQVGDIFLTNSTIDSGSSAYAGRPMISSSSSGDGGNISFVTQVGDIFLTNSTIDSGSSAYAGSDTTSSSSSGNGGNILFAANLGNIAISTSTTSSSTSSTSSFTSLSITPFLFPTSSNSGNGGKISFATNFGNISLTNSTSNSQSSSIRSKVSFYRWLSSSSLYSGSGSGGDISFATNFGNISLTNSTSDSSSISNSGSGGDVSFATNFGNISLTNSTSNSQSSWSYSGRNGGDISFATNFGDISLIDSTARSGSGGDISFATNFGNISLTGLTCFASSRGDISFATNFGNISLTRSSSASGEGGDISFATNFGNISLTRSSSYSDSGGDISFATNFGNISLTDSTSYSYGGGDISFATNFGNISLTDSMFSSYKGDISFTTNFGNISLTDSPYLSSSEGDISFATNFGNISLTNSTARSDRGGNISFATNFGDISLINSTSNSSSYWDSGNGGDIFFTTNFGDISLINSTSNSSPGRSGNGGDISFTTNFGDISLINSTSDSSSGFYSGNGGDISFATNFGNISLINLTLSSSSHSSDAGNGGNIAFVTNSGDIFLTNSTLNSYSSPYYGNVGNSGNIAFVTNFGDIFLTNSTLNSYSSVVNSYSFLGHSFFWYPRDAGNGENIALVTNSGDIFLTNSTLNSYSSVVDSYSSFYWYPRNAENGGDIYLSARRGAISGNSATLNSWAASQWGGSGNGGKVTLEAGREISGLTINTIASGGLSGDVEINGFGNLRIANTRILTPRQVKTGAYFNAPIINLGGRGQAGNVTVTSTGNLTLSNSLIENETRSSNPAGNINLRANQNIEITDGSSITSATASSGKGGNINITANNLTIHQGARVTSITTGSGQAGDIVVNTSDRLMIAGQGTGLFAKTTPSATGAGGSILIDPTQVSLLDGARIAVESQGQGQAGNVQLQARSLFLDNAALLSTTASGEGGNLNLTVSDLIVLRNNSTISAEATGAGSGSNITIINPKGMIIAVPTENSDVVASTLKGSSGGNIHIVTGQLIGIAYRTHLTPLSDITGTRVDLNNQRILDSLRLEPHAGLPELNLELVDSATATAKNCSAQPASAPPNAMIEATGWSIDSNGQVTLTAQPTGTSIAHPLLKNGAATCVYP